MSDLVGNPEDMFSHDKAVIYVVDDDIDDELDDEEGEGEEDFEGEDEVKISGEQRNITPFQTIIILMLYVAITEKTIFR